MNRFMATATVALGVAWLTPSVGYAEGQGNCKTEARVCEFGGATCRDDNGDRGRCRQIGNQCTCFTANDGAKENAINTIFDSSTAAVVIVEDEGLPRRCDQFRALVGNMAMSAGRLVTELDPVRFVEPALLKRVDVSLGRLPVIGSLFSSSGGCEGTVPSVIGLGLNKAKDELLEQLEKELDDGTIK